LNFLPELKRKGQGKNSKAFELLAKVFRNVILAGFWPESGFSMY